jgi:phosphate transport system substrate-binding protein
MFYSLCEGQSKAGAYGYSPLPLNLVQAGFDQLKKLKAADPKVDVAGREVTRCNNPTFVAGNLSRNKLAEVAPQPAACDKVGAGPCGGQTGTAPTTTEEAAAGGEAAAGAGPAGDAPAAGAVGAAPASGAIDPVTGAPVGAAAAAGTSTGTATAVPVELLAGRAGDERVFGALAAVELVALVVVPGVLAAWMRKRRRAA